MSETHLSIATSSLAAKALAEPMLNVNPRADLPSVNVQEVILVIPTPTVSEILVVLIHVVSIEYLQNKYTYLDRLLSDMLFLVCGSSNFTRVAEVRPRLF